VVRGIDLALSRGEIVGLIGVNGSGKSTLLRVCGGLLAPRVGEVSLSGLALSSLPRKTIARRLALVPQQAPIELPFSAADVVLMGRYPHSPGLPTNEDLAAAAQAMERCDVLHLGSQRFDSISGGERRRVLLAQALCQRVDVLLLDEPSASLDPAHDLTMFRELRKERERGAGILLATHDLDRAASYCDRLLVLANGEVIALGAALDVVSNQAIHQALGVRLHLGHLPDGGPFVVAR
jgi:iron complex transport system ATP-binding protein